MKVHDDFMGIFLKGELYGIEQATVAGITADQLSKDSKGKPKYVARPVVIVEGDGALAMILALVDMVKRIARQ